MDILISGVGGQGTILASKILANGAVTDGSKRARTGETIGMSQRGGCVVSHVRTSDTYSPYIPAGGADLLLSFELCEGARNLPMLKKGGTAVINTAKINPVTVSLGASVYDEEKITEYIKSNCKAYFLDADRLAKKCGSLKAVNVLLVGTAFGLGLLDISKTSLYAAIKNNVKPEFYKMNIKAFECGENYALTLKG